MSREDGGPAFPSQGEQIVEHGTGEILGLGDVRGMSLRDFFATAAVIGIISRNDIDLNMKEYVRGAYRLADLMLAERSKP